MKQVQHAATIAGIVLAVAGGMYFGLFSCGGFQWHKTAFPYVFIPVLLLILICRPYSMRHLLIRSLIVVTLCSSYTLVEASSAAFYPTNPGSAEEFWRLFLFHLENGPC